MDLSKLRRGTVRSASNRDLKFRLARPADADFLALISQLAGADHDTGRLCSTYYQRGLRHALARPAGGFYTAVIEAYNRDPDHGDRLQNAARAASFDIVGVLGDLFQRLCRT